jgi:hypothetical protein
MTKSQYVTAAAVAASTIWMMQARGFEKDQQRFRQELYQCVDLSDRADLIQGSAASDAARFHTCISRIEVRADTLGNRLYDFLARY